MSFPEVGRWLRKRQGRLVSDDEHIRGLGRISEFEQEPQRDQEFARAKWPLHGLRSCSAKNSASSSIGDLHSQGFDGESSKRAQCQLKHSAVGMLSPSAESLVQALRGVQRLSLSAQCPNYSNALTQKARGRNFRDSLNRSQVKREYHDIQRKLRNESIAEKERRLRELQESRPRFISEEHIQQQKREPSVSLEPLSKDEEQAVKEVFESKKDPEEVLFERQFKAKSYATMPIRRKDLQLLKPGEWLNDEVINFYCGLMQERALREAGENQQPTVHYFGSYFYPKLSESGYSYERVRRWSTTKRLGGYQLPYTERIIVPINKSNVHWVLAVVNIKERKVEFYDSMHSIDRQIMKDMLQYIRDEAKNKLNEDWDTSDWEMEAPEVPRQDNTCDCGVFAVKFADAIGKGREVGDVTADRMPFLRRRIAADILRGKVD